MISSSFADQELETYGNSWHLSNHENDCNPKFSNRLSKYDKGMHDPLSSKLEITFYILEEPKSKLGRLILDSMR